MAPDRFKVGTALALALIAAFVLVHPEVDLVYGVFHRGQHMQPDLTAAIIVVANGLTVVAATAPQDTTPVSTVFRPDSLDLLCVRLC
jgi:hypothetical protein